MVFAILIFGVLRFWGFFGKFNGFTTKVPKAIEFPKETPKSKGPPTEVLIKPLRFPKKPKKPKPSGQRQPNGTYIHTHIHAYIHTHTHTYIHTCIRNVALRMRTFTHLSAADACPYGLAAPEPPPTVPWDSGGGE